MLQSVDLRGIQPESSDRRLLRAYLQQLAGQPFLHFRFSYGDELSLHFGSPRRYPSPRLKDLRKGSYIIASRASSWYLLIDDPPSAIAGTCDDSPIATTGTEPLTKERLETAGFVKQGARILAADVVVFPSARAGFALTLVLSDGSRFLIRPNLDDPIQDDDPADWEVFTPYDRCIEVGPGLQWAYVDTRAASEEKKPE